MTTETYTFNNYTFNLELVSNQINIKLTDNTLLEMYEGNIKKKDTYIKISKFYSMIVKSINNEPNYKMTISDTNNSCMCIISFNSDIIDFEQKIILNKINSYKTKELLLVQKIKKLSDELVEIEKIKIRNEKLLEQASKTTAELENNWSYFS